jgi:hypothetical protein
MTDIVLGGFIVAPLLVAAFATLVWWTRLRFAGLFFVTGTIALLGLRSIVRDLVAQALLPPPGTQPSSPIGSIAGVEVLTLVVTTALGWLYLIWLSRPFRRADALPR